MVEILPRYGPNQFRTWDIPFEGERMVLTTRLALICMVGLSVALVVKVTRAISSPPVVKAVENADVSSEPNAFGPDVQREPLIKADKLPVAFVSEGALQANRIEPAIDRPAETIQGSETTTPEIVSRHWRDPYPFIAKDKPLGRQSNEPHKKSIARADKPCPEGGVHDLLRSLKLSPNCRPAVASADAASPSSRTTGAK
jgi:hypothetical protein